MENARDTARAISRGVYEYGGDVGASLFPHLLQERADCRKNERPRDYRENKRREHERRAPRAERAIKRRRHGYYREHQNVCDHRRYLQPYEHSDKRRYETEYSAPHQCFFIIMQHTEIVSPQSVGVPAPAFFC